MADITIHHTKHADWLANAYLVVNRSARQGPLIDGNGVSGPLLDRIDRDGIDITAILLTHHHADHVDIGAYGRLDAPIFAHPETARLARLTQPVQGLVHGEIVRTACMRIAVLSTPGHALDHLAFVIEDRHCFTADVLFRGTVGGTRGPGGSDLSELRRSIHRVLSLNSETVLYPGHGGPTTVSEELATNPFVLAWRDRAPTTGKPCTVQGEPAELLLWGPDYDGTNKAWIRLPDGAEHVLGGSQVVRDVTSA